MGLAESYERSGDKAHAVENYREALKRDPGNIVVNTMAKGRLDECVVVGNPLVALTASSSLVANMVANMGG